MYMQNENIFDRAKLIGKQNGGNLYVLKTCKLIYNNLLCFQNKMTEFMMKARQQNITASGNNSPW